MKEEVKQIFDDAEKANREFCIKKQVQIDWSVIKRSLASIKSGVVKATL